MHTIGSGATSIILDASGLILEVHKFCAPLDEEQQAPVWMLQGFRMLQARYFPKFKDVTRIIVYFSMSEGS